MAVIVRPVEKDDKDRWIELWAGDEGYLAFRNSRSEVSQETTEITFGRFLDPNEPMYCAVAEDPSSGKVIGFANYLTHRNTQTISDALYLNDLFVDSSCRLKGVGRTLIEYIYSEADKFKCEKCYWATQFENHRAQLLYTKVGVKSGFLLYRRP